MSHRCRGVLAAIPMVAFAGCLVWPIPEPSEDTSKPVGLIQLIEFQEIEGLRNWAYELQQRGLTSLVFLQKNIVEAYPTDVKWLADQGHEIAGGYAQQPFWDVPYETQLEIMTQTKQLVEQVAGKPMRVFGSKYFAYDENTLKAADVLGIEYVLARGTSDVEAIIYQPDEYKCRIISVSNVPFQGMGRDSLCDYSLWARGAMPLDFAAVLDDTLAKRPRRIMVASHTNLGGMKADWWLVYKVLLNSGRVRWASGFDDWVSKSSGVNLQLPLSLIPSNREVKYETPDPAIPLDELANLDQMNNPCSP